jgi:uncharacterized protein (TIGR02271 family)
MQTHELVIRRGADVVGPEGPFGTVSHVVIDEPTREISELIVRRPDGQQWLVPSSVVRYATTDSVIVHSGWSELGPTAHLFASDEFEPISAAETVRASVPVTETTARLRPRDLVQSERGSLELREEELLVRKQPREIGAVELRKEIVAERQTLEVLVWYEELLLERQPLNPPRPSTEAIAEHPPLRVVLREEVAAVDKQPVVTEVVRAGRRTVNETQHVEIEKEGDVHVRGTEPMAKRPA